MSVETRKPKPKKCKVCKESFSPWVSTMRACSPECALVLVREDQEKKKRKELKERKKAARPRSWYVKDAQKWFNKFIRLRDKDEPCICCDRPPTNDIQWHAGHLLTTGARPEHRFNENNCHKQTSYCNNFLSGNVAEYRKRLVKKIGLEAVEAMEQDHEPKKYTIDDLKELIVKYKAKCKEIERDD